MKKRRVCFVSFELAPFTGGGIGTWLANTLNAYRDTSTQFEILFATTHPPAKQEFQRRFPGVILHAINVDEPDPQALSGRALARDDFATHAQWCSYLFMAALERLQTTTGRFDVIEFIDWCGTAFYSINAKRLGRSFQDTVLSVRLHVTETVLRAYETREWVQDNLIIADLERQALLNADVVVGHLAPVADACQKIFGFPDDWRARCIIELPPVVVANPSNNIAPPSNVTNLVFTSKIQSFKRPEIFARGVSRFIGEAHHYSGTAHFLALEVDRSLKARCEFAFPESLSSRVLFGGPSDIASREAMISKSVAVFPGVFEAFCFAAYEASMVGATVILNRNNPGFGDSTPWIDGKNCIKFDGTVQDLHLKLSDLFQADARNPKLEPVAVCAAERPYWTTVSAGSLPRRDPLSLSVVVVSRYDAGPLYKTLDSILAQPGAPFQIVVASEAGRDDPTSGLVLDGLEQLARETGLDVALRRFRGGFGVGSLLRDALSLATGDIIAIVPAGFELLDDFLDGSVRALSRQPDYDAVLPAGEIIEGEGSPSRCWLPLGASVNMGLFANGFSTGCIVARRSLLDRFPPDETLTAEWIWDMALRAAFSGCRFIVTDEPAVRATNSVFFDYASFTERDKRETVEIVRRSLSVIGDGARVNLNVLGDHSPR